MAVTPAWMRLAHLGTNDGVWSIDAMDPHAILPCSGLTDVVAGTIPSGLRATQKLAGFPGLVLITGVATTNRLAAVT
jgi:hypothetical protein